MTSKIINFLVPLWELIAGDQATGFHYFCKLHSCDFMQNGVAHPNVFDNFISFILGTN